MEQVDEYKEAIEEMLDSLKTAQANLLHSISKEQSEDGLYLTMMTAEQKQPVQRQIQSLSIPFQHKALKQTGCGTKDIREYASTLPPITEALMLRTMLKGLNKKDRKAALQEYDSTEERERVGLVLELLKQIKNSKKNQTISQTVSESSKASPAHKRSVTKPINTEPRGINQDVRNDSKEKGRQDAGGVSRSNKISNFKKSKEKEKENDTINNQNSSQNSNQKSDRNGNKNSKESLADKSDDSVSDDSTDDSNSDDGADSISDDSADGSVSDDSADDDISDNSISEED
ncbi:hypothetical protein J4E82_010791 [Alternaria postmessia]|uniref:uncharacterized protein n=1 Tax=Alternaria postmessia TaxID=1187938 RepID=UPI0022241DDC|nr:uncharacterized protein J4E82_010791 [Alternaria postmessia]KAI5368427.1 hypothetical protein J4E82_010791 [Alternaria postmessia]